MTVAFDATVLLLMLRSGVRAPLDPATGQPVEHAEERIAQLVGDLDRGRVRIVVPTPALAELLVRAGSLGSKMIEVLTKSSRFSLAPFDVLAAIEVAEMTRAAMAAGDKRAGAIGSWAKVKYDRQIIAIAKVSGADTIYTDDADLRSFAEAQKLRVVGVSELPFSTDRAQIELELPETSAVEGRAGRDDAEHA